jgi:hypothetical protein
LAPFTPIPLSPHGPRNDDSEVRHGSSVDRSTQILKRILRGDVIITADL